jgi:RimJ/RimL family protein N-acetyltransferase
MAPDGKPIIALPSTAHNGAVSRIRAELTPGAGVVTTRGDVHYVATEYGVAYLHGKSLHQRALALISIAHPRFREELLAKAKEYNYLFEDAIIPEGAIYPVAVEHEHAVGDVTLFIRPVKRSDERLMQEYLYTLSARSVYMRFFQTIKSFPWELAQEVVAVDYHERMGIVATVGSADAERIVAHAHWILNVNTNQAEVAYSVADELQGRGIGQYISHLLVRLAREQGIRGFRAETLTHNIPMRRIFEHEANEAGSSLHATYEEGVVSIWFNFGERAEAPNRPTPGPTR